MFHVKHLPVFFWYNDLQKTKNKKQKTETIKHKKVNSKQ